MNAKYYSEILNSAIVPLDFREESIGPPTWAFEENLWLCTCQ